MGRPRPAARLGPPRGPRADRASVEPDRAARNRVLSRRARDLREPHRRGEPHAAAGDRPRRTWARGDPRALSEPPRAAPRRRNDLVGRRAADAGDRPDPPHRRAPPAARRTDGRGGAGRASGRSIRPGARLLLLGEPTEGLAPVIVEQIGVTLRRLKSEGFTVLL